MLPQRNFVMEEFTWRNKKVIFDLITKHRKSGVVLLSGDIHFA